MKILLALLATAIVLAGCASRTEKPPPVPAPPSPPPPLLPPAAHTPLPLRASIVPALALDAYKRILAAHISQQSASMVYEGRPQALLRSVVVLRYAVDARGALVKSEIQRSNHDRETEAAALHALRAAAPFPAPSPNLLHNDRLEMSETWLFNNDGRFQLRTIALPQMDR
jgi:periplasmic protein TonB